MFGDRGVGRVRQAQFLEADGTLLLRRSVWRTVRQEAFQQHLLDVGPRQLALEGAADDLAAAAQLCHSICIWPASSVMFLAANCWAAVCARARSMLSPPSRM